MADRLTEHIRDTLRNCERWLRFLSSLSSDDFRENKREITEGCEALVDELAGINDTLDSAK